MLSRIRLKFGSSPGQQALAFRPGATTVFVGPNNSGKSLVLVELERLAMGAPPNGCLIVDGIDVAKVSADQAYALIMGRKNEKETAKGPDGQIRLTSIHPINSSRKDVTMSLDEGIGRLTSGDDPQWICGHVVSLYTLRLDGHTRLSILAPKAASDLLAPPASLLSSLFASDDVRVRIRAITEDAFGRYFVIDPTGMQHFRVRMSSRAPEDNLEEQGLDARARVFHQAAPLIQELSDGVVAFSGLVAAVMSSDYRVMLIDEPEAFLHPPLAKKLGRTLAGLAAERNGHVLASTHSAEFLMGVIESGRPTDVVRLTFEDGIPSARLLPAEDLARLMRDPLLRSTGVLSALFHKGAVVCEADSDRAFYREVSERLLAANRSGAVDALFVNAHSKDVLRRIARPLRELGIPAAIVVDLDIIKTKDAFSALLGDAFVPPALVQAWGTLRGTVLAKCEAAGAQTLKQGGMSALGTQAREEAETLLKSLADYGVFVVPNGELESWLKTLGVGAHGNEWLTKMFERMGSDPASRDYVLPAEGDVWGFMETVSRWLANPLRKGMPT